MVILSSIKENLKKENLNNKTMSLSEIKLYLINGGALSITTFTKIEIWLKIILLVVTIAYTIRKFTNIK